MSNGDVQVKYEDGSCLMVKSTLMEAKFTDPGGKVVAYKKDGLLPTVIRQHLSQMPKVIKYLMEAQEKFRPKTRSVR